MIMEHRQAHSFYQELKCPLSVVARQIGRSGRIKAFLETIRTILWW